MSHIPNGRWFGPGVLVGNWFEENALENDHIKDYMKKRDNGQLICEKRLGITETITRKMELSTSRDGKVHFGDVVLILNPPPKNNSRLMHALTMTWSDLFMHDYEHTICSESVKVAASECNILPNFRNSFVVTSCDGSHDGEVLRYAQPFYLCTADRRMYLSSDRFAFDHMTKHAHQPELMLEDYPHYLAEWNVKPFNPLIRMELQYSPVQANAKVIIAHCKTNRALCLEPFPFKSSFGHEKEVSIHTCLDTHKAEEDVNHWMFMMKVPGDCLMPVVEPNETHLCPPLAKSPEEEPECQYVQQCYPLPTECCNPVCAESGGVTDPPTQVTSHALAYPYN